MLTLRRSLDQSGHGGMSPIQSDHQAPTLGTVSKWPGTIGMISIIFAVLGIMCWGCGSGSSVLQLVAPDFMSQFSQIEYQKKTVTAPDMDAAAAPLASDERESQSVESVQNAQTTDNETPDQVMPAEEQADQQGSNSVTISKTLKPSTDTLILDIISNVVSLGMSIWLLCAGIGVLRRKSWSVSSLIAWSWVRILVAIGWFIVMWMSLDGSLEIMLSELQAESMKHGQETPFSMEMMWTVAIITIVAMGLVLIAWPVFLIFFLGRQRIRDEVATWGGDKMPSEEWDRV